ncbi:MAG TPA: methylated-DNA--[protein]-cysteine S-methyltransferase [Acidimicrobiales bacterium]|nr:methylated-DNA--[protein]-cysteine S-methyltransferase [Acidimicrobiales bacterium]
MQTQSPETSYCYVDSPMGTILLTADGEALSGVYFTDHRHSPAPATGWRHDDAALEPVRAQFREYFDGRRRQFDLPVVLHGSPFELTVWAALRDVPYGETVSYGHIARAIGRPTAARAVGAANGRNPVCIVVPCHRVIGANGTLTGYGWGLERKVWLLDHEKRPAGSQRRSTTATAGVPSERW